MANARGGGSRAQPETFVQSHAASSAKEALGVWGNSGSTLALPCLTQLSFQKHIVKSRGEIPVTDAGGETGSSTPMKWNSHLVGGKIAES